MCGILMGTTDKLIRWGIVIHADGTVDGYSTLPLYLKASSNNKASTVLTWFLEAVREYGLPSHVQCDKGGKYNAWYLILC